MSVAASWLVVALWSASWAGYMWPSSGLSWHYTVDGARLLLHGSGLNLFADAPWLQTGPLSLVLAALLSPLPADVARGVALVMMAAAGPLLVASLAPLVAPEARRRRVFLAAIVLIPAWTVLAVRYGHLDDVLALVFAVVALRAVCAERPVLAGAALALAVAAKPWAIGFVPLLLALPRARLRVGAAWAAAGVAMAGRIEFRRWTAVLTLASRAEAGAAAGARGACRRSSASRDSAAAAAVWNRSSGFLARQRRTTAASSREIPRSSSISRGTSVSKCFCAIERNVRPVKSRRPVNSSNAMTPIA